MKIILRRGEKIQTTLKRFRKLLEKEGVIKEMKRQMYYESPSQEKSRVKRKAVRDREKALENPEEPKSQKQNRKQL